MMNSQKGFNNPLIVVLVGIIILAIGGIFYFGRPSNRVANPSVQNQADKTVDWKTFSNDKYGFEMKYPKDWLFEAKSTGGTSPFLDIHLNNSRRSDNPAACDKGFIGLEIQVGITKNANQDFGEFVNLQVSPQGFGLNPGGAIEQISVGNRRAFKVERSGWDTSCKGPGYFIEQDQADYIYIFTGSDVPIKGTEVFDQILSTFKFTDPAANWKTYTNTIYGYALKYPENFYLEERGGGVSFNDAQLEQDKGYILPIWINIIDSTLSIREWLDQKGTSQGWNSPISYAYLFVQDIKENRINNIPVLQFQSSAASSTMYHTLIKGPDPALIFEIVRGWNSLGSIPVEIYNEMLSTFKFTDPAANWKTYTNATYGFSIKFPDTYEVPPQTSREISQLGKDTQACITSKADGICRIVFHTADNPRGLSASEYVKTLPEIPLNDYLRQAQPVIFNGYAALTWVDNDTIGHMVGSDTTIVEIGAHATPILDQILSTFKFTQ